MGHESAAFWAWFRENSRALRRVRSADAPKYTELQRRLAQLSPDIDCEIGGGGPSGHLELILTAHGERRLFPMIDEIVADAPSVEGWIVRALKPALLEDLSIEYESEKMASENVWLSFNPSAGPDGRLPLTVAIPGVRDPGRSQTRQSVALVVIESFIGERAYAAQIVIDGFIDLPDDPRGQGMMSLRDLADRLQLSRLQ